jgi:toxin ParE1/3/4
MAAHKRAVIWSPEAETDLADIWSYYRETAGPQLADSRVRAIGKACLLLEEHPLAGRAREEIRPGLRSVLVNPHVVFYRVTNEIAQIVRILDGRRDIEDIFAET